MHHVAAVSTSFVAPLPIEQEWDYASISLKTLVVAVAAIAGAALGFYVASIIGLYIGAAAGGAISFTAIRLNSWYGVHSHNQEQIAKFCSELLDDESAGAEFPPRTLDSPELKLASYNISGFGRTDKLRKKVIKKIDELTRNEIKVRISYFYDDGWRYLVCPSRELELSNRRAARRQGYGTHDVTLYKAED